MLAFDRLSTSSWRDIYFGDEGAKSTRIRDVMALLRSIGVEVALSLFGEAERVCVFVFGGHGGARYPCISGSRCDKMGLRV